MRGIVLLVSVCEFLLAGFFLLGGILTAGMTVIARDLDVSDRILMGLVGLAFLGIAAGIYFTARALYTSARWAYWVSLVLGIIVSAIAADGIWDPARANYNSDQMMAYYVNVTSFIPAVVALVCWVLPANRRAYFSTNNG